MGKNKFSKINNKQTSNVQGNEDDILNKKSKKKKSDIALEIDEKTKEQDSLITRFSLFFVKNFRVSLLLIIASLLLGFLAYTSILKREGFPSIAFPIALVNVVYPVDDPQIVRNEVILPIEKILQDREDIDTYRSSITSSGGVINIAFTNEVTDVRDVLAEIQKDLKISGNLPNSALINFTPLNVGSLNGVDDLVINLTFKDSINRDLSDEELLRLQELSYDIVEDLQTEKSIREARVIDIFKTVESTDSNSNDPQIVQNTFNSVVIKSEGTFEKYNVVGIGLIKDSSIGAVDFSKLVQEKFIELLNTNKYSELKYIVGIDPAISVNKQIASLEINVLTGLIVLSLALFLIIGWRSSLIIVIFVPIVLSLTLITFTFIDFSINTITLFGLILVLGVIADDAIIVMEAIEYHKRNGKKGLQAVRSAINDIGLADIAGTITTVLVFVPLLFTTGILGDFIQQIPLTVVITLLWSLFIGLSAVAFMSNVIFKAHDDKVKDNNDSIFNRIAKILDFFPSLSIKLGEFLSVFVSKYAHKLTFSLGVVMGTIAIVAGLVMVLIGGVGDNLFPPSKDGDGINIVISFDEGLDISDSEKINSKIEDIIVQTLDKNLEKVEVIQASNANAVLDITLISYADRTVKSPELVEDLSKALNNIPKARVSVTAQSAGGPPPAEFPVAVKIFSEDEEVLEKATNDVESFLKNKEVNEVKGETIKIEETLVSFVNVIETQDSKRFAQVGMKFSDGFDDSTFAEITKIIEEEYDTDRLNKLDLIKENFIVDRGQQADFAESFSSVVTAFYLSVIIMYGYLVVQLRSFSLPLLVFVAVPLTLPGVLFILNVTSNDASFFVAIGFVALFGIVVNNSIILIDYANSMIRTRGLTIGDAIVESIKVRARPIMATTLTTLGGLLPLALADPFWESLALTLIFGLLSSLIFVVTTFPAFYVVVQHLRFFKDKLFSGIKLEER